MHRDLPASPVPSIVLFFASSFDRPLLPHHVHRPLSFICLLHYFFPIAVPRLTPPAPFLSKSPPHPHPFQLSQSSLFICCASDFSFLVQGRSCIRRGLGYLLQLLSFVYAVYNIIVGITPCPNLNHYDLPRAPQDMYNGWLRRQVQKCLQRPPLLSDLNWQTFNEPRVVAALGYDSGFFAPGRCSKAFVNCTEGNSTTEPYIVAHILILCHAAAAQRHRDKYEALRFQG
ncbi:hypothetical protein OROMI_002507 [Orobanche minor]